MRLDSK